MQEDQAKKTYTVQNIIYKIALVGILSALSYVGVLIHIPIPSAFGNTMIHLGNLVVVIASLLFGGIVGGISGSIGMGLYDIMAGYDIWSITRTIILKFLIGIITGFVYHKLNKKNEKAQKYITFILGGILLIVGITFMIISLNNNGYLEISNVCKKEIICASYVFSIINGIFLIVVGFFSKKMPRRLQLASIATSLAMVVNILGEFIYKVLKQLTLGETNLINSIYTGFLSLPATLINVAITLAIILLVFIPIEEAVKKSLNK